MAPYKQPHSLQAMCTKCVARLVQTSSLRICREKRFTEVEAVRQHVHAYIQPLMDDLCRYIYLDKKSQKLKASVSELVLKICSRPQMKRLYYWKKENFDQGFWKQHMSLVPNLVELDISNLLYIPNGTFQAIAKHCRQLEELYFKFLCVKIQDFLLLENVETLRIIQNERCSLPARNPFYTLKHKDSYRVITQIVESLPKLEYIDCHRMGFILNQFRGMKFPSLKWCWETRPTCHFLEAIAYTCPNLEELTLGNCLYNNATCDLTPLKESSLEVSTFTVFNFLSMELIIDYLNGKGKFLKSLNLNKIPDITPQQLQLIGTHSPQLKYLTIHIGSCYGRQANTSTRFDVQEPVFQNLTHFFLTADKRPNQYKSYVGLLLCLAYARELQTLVFKEGTVVGSECYLCLENILSELLHYNSMLQLQYMAVAARFLGLKIKTIEFLIALPQIRVLTLKLHYSPHELNTVLPELQYSLEKKNLDIKLTLT